MTERWEDLLFKAEGLRSDGRWDSIVFWGDDAVDVHQAQVRLAGWVAKERSEGQIVTHTQQLLGDEVVRLWFCVLPTEPEGLKK